jgi:hypothetical protein
MLLTGLALAVVLLIAVQLTHSLRGMPSEKSDGVIEQQDLNETVKPVFFTAISEEGTRLRLSGESEPGATISIEERGTSLQSVEARQDGKWTTVLDIADKDMMAIELVVDVGSGAKIRSDETLYRVPPPVHQVSTDTHNVQSMIMVTAPGGPTRLIQSPFRGLPTSGPLSLGPVDYDEDGGVILSGRSEVPGQVRISANDVFVGEAQISQDGRWFLIAAETLPTGVYDLTASLIDGNKTVSEVSVPFERLRLGGLVTSSVKIAYNPSHWQIARNLYGGGRQYTVVFAPGNIDPVPPAP